MKSWARVLLSLWNLPLYHLLQLPLVCLQAGMDQDCQWGFLPIHLLVYAISSTVRLPWPWTHTGTLSPFSVAEPELVLLTAQRQGKQGGSRWSWSNLVSRQTLYWGLWSGAFLVLMLFFPPFSQTLPWIFGESCLQKSFLPVVQRQENINNPTVSVESTPQNFSWLFPRGRGFCWCFFFSGGGIVCFFFYLLPWCSGCSPVSCIKQHLFSLLHHLKSLRETSGRVSWFPHWHCHCRPAVLTAEGISTLIPGFSVSCEHPWEVCGEDPQSRWRLHFCS